MKTILTTSLTTLLFSNIGFAQASASKPNIIFIMADDIGYGDISCYNQDSKISTPNIDQLAQDGMRFTDAHSVAALSSPSRYGLLTGRYSFRSRLKSGVLGKNADPLIEANRLTVGKLLQQNGYNTACFGKWHLGVTWTRDNDGNIDLSKQIKNGPITRGFDYYFGINMNNSAFFIENDMAIEVPSVPKPPEMYGNEELICDGWKYENLLPTLSNKVIEYIKNPDEQYRNSDKPFFIYYAANTVHTPIAPVDEFKGSSKAHLYGDFIQQFDWEIGRILEALEEENIAENTLIIFTSDNGPMHWDGTNMQGPLNSIFKYDHNPSYIFRGKKSDIHEAGHRIPFIVRWPAQTPKNTVSDELISHVDFMATCAAIIGENLPAGAGEDSHNFSPVFKGEKLEKPVRNYLINISGGGKLALRMGNWKFIEAGGSGGFTAPKSDAEAEALGLPPIQLYNLEDDIGETINLQDKYPEKLAEMRAILDSIRFSSGNSVANNEIYTEKLSQ